MEKAYVKVWESCLEIIRDNVSSQSFKTWFEPIKPVKLSLLVLYYGRFTAFAER